MIQIAFSVVPSQTFPITLDGINYNLKLVWNSRGEFWTISISDANQNTIVSGIKMTLNYGVLQDYRAYSVPPGDLMFLDTSGDETKIEFEDFGNNRPLNLVYVEAADFAAV